MIYHVNKLKNKKHPIISIDVEKVFDKIQHQFIIKNLQKGDIKGTYLTTIRPYMTNPWASLVAQWERDCLPMQET